MRSAARVWISIVVFVAINPLIGTFASASSSPAAGAGSTGDPVDFVRDVRPIFGKHCLACHGPEKQKSGLRLDRKRDALSGGDSGPAIVPGKSAESDLIARVVGDDPETAMPPKGERLTAKEVDVVRAWIDSGATWPDGVDGESSAKSTHWAFSPTSRPATPAPRRQDWGRNPIDAFILSRLETERVEPSAEADRPTLIRRLSLDLLGLPPTRAEFEEFMNDRSFDAYERLVDRLLASPHFGERWGRHWLDLARYADSDGYEKDTGRPHAWRYRDWVVNSLNHDLPFDQFTIEQLAGDLLPDATIDQKIATGFHRNTLTNKEGGADPEEFRTAAVVDRANTTGTVWLGLTVGCAQCHTHKYDPILQREYYGLFAFFNNAREVDLAAPLPGEQEKYDQAKFAFDRDHAPLEAALKDYNDQGRPTRQAEWESVQRATPTQWTPLQPISFTSANGATLTKLPDDSILASGANPETDTYTIIAHSSVRGVTALRLEALDHESLGARGPGRAGHGNFVLSEFSVSATPLSDEEESGELALSFSAADFSQTAFPAAAAIDRNLKSGWAVAPRFGERHWATFETRDDLPNSLGGQFTIRIEQQHGLKHTLGRFRVSATAVPRPVRVYDLPDGVAAILAKPDADRTAADKGRLAAHHRSIDPESQRLSALVAAHQKKAPPPPASRAQTLAEEEKRRPTHVLIRGDFLRKGEEVKPGTPAFLPALGSSEAIPNRVDLARWLMDPKNPLTARVAVNRIWRHLFGRPLATSVDDFGTRGEKPSHPELLDWLASEYPRRGWSQKSLIRLIATSSTYRQASHARPELVDRDPNNIWLSRQNRFRPEAEVVRDMALRVSGLLAPRLGGPSVRPPQPPGISELTYANSAKWVESRGADRYRRGFYTWFQRTSPYPMLMTFDAPDSNVCAAKRERSNTPLQALTLLNDGVFVECAQAVSRLIFKDPSDDPGRGVSEVFQACLSRPPTDDERTLVSALYEKLRQEFQRDPKAAASMAGPNPPTDVDQPTLAAWVAIARTIMNADEFVTRE
jgi:mono/diheme cytochrome c family protein